MVQTSHMDVRIVALLVSLLLMKICVEETSRKDVGPVVLLASPLLMMSCVVATHLLGCVVERLNYNNQTDEHHSHVQETRHFA